jgi:MFS family permease
MIALAGLVVFCAAPGMTYGTAAFVDPLTADLGISRSVFSLAYAVATLFAALVLLIVGRQIDRWGGRLVMAISTIGLAIGVLWLSFAAGPAWIFVGFAMTRTFGQSVMPLAAKIIVPHWFIRNRGRAFSAIGIAGTLSVALMPPIHAWLISQVGWRTTWRIDAFWLVLLLTPVILLFIRNRPEEIGQVADGADKETSSPEPIVDRGMTLKQAMHTWMFWGLIVATVVPQGIVTGLALNQGGIYSDRGYPGSLTGITFTIESMAMFGATALIGTVIDRVPLRYVLALSQVLLVIAMLVLLTGQSFVLGVVYAIFRGASMAIVLVAGDVAWPSYYGRRHLGSIRGFAASIGVFGSALGPLPLGLAFDQLGGYGPGIAGMISLPIVAGIFILATRPPTVAGAPVIVGI